MLLDMAFFIYAFCPSYEQTRKLISIIVYINNELNFKKDTVAKNKLENLINRYGFVYTNGNVFDLIDWFAFLFEYRITLSTKIEEVIIQKACQLNDPIVWANLLLYSRYNNTFFNEIKIKIEITIQSELEKISDKSKMLNKEFWFVLIFHNCPDISPQVTAKIDSMVQGIKPAITSGTPSDRAINLVYGFLQKKVNGKKPENSFFNWSGDKGMGDKITYRTYQRTIFKKYNKTNGFYASLD